MSAILKFAAMCCLVACNVTAAFAQDSGEATYTLKCAMCHGADGLSNTPAGKVFKSASFRDPAIAKLTDDEMIAIVQKGKNKMPAFGDKLTEAQIKSAVAYIRTLQTTPPK